MARRMTDTDKWKKPFIKSLPTEYKLFWIYLTDDINHAGIWEVDKEIAELRLGTKLSLEKALGLFDKKVVAFDNGTKWFLPDFILFQYGNELNERNKVHQSVIKLLIKYTLMIHLRGLVALKDKDKVIDKEQLELLLKEKKQKFKKSLDPFLEDYGKDILNTFYRYWSESTPDQRYLKWELEDTWEVKLRLIKWVKQDAKFNK